MLRYEANEVKNQDFDACLSWCPVSPDRPTWILKKNALGSLEKLRLLFESDLTFRDFRNFPWWVFSEVFSMTNFHHFFRFPNCELMGFWIRGNRFESASGSWPKKSEEWIFLRDQLRR